MSKVTVYEATREQVVSFCADCEAALGSFDASRAHAVASPLTEGLIRELRSKWDPQKKTRGMEMSSAGRYGRLSEAILRLPRLNDRRRWYSALYAALGTGRSAL